MKKNIQKISIFVPIFLICFSIFFQNTEAAKVETNLSIPMAYFGELSGMLNFNGLGLQRVTRDDVHATVEISLSKVFNFVKQNNSIVGLTPALEIGDTLTPKPESITGSWLWTQYNFLRNIGQQMTYYQDQGTPQTGGREILVHSTKVYDPSDNDADIKIASNRQDVVECLNNTCTAKSAGTAKITVSFPSSKKVGYTSQNFSAPYWQERPNGTRQREVTSQGKLFYGDDSGYGRIKIVGFADSNLSSHDTSNLKTMTYSFPSITYTVTVPAGNNEAPTAAWITPDPVSQSAAQIKWTYFDKENDPQTAYWIQISTSQDFSASTIVKSISGNSAAVSQVIYDLAPNTVYYGRIRVMNAVNTDWTGWVSGSFRTLEVQEIPCDPATQNCDQNPPCDPATQTCNDDNGTGGSGISCSVTNNTVLINQDALYTTQSINGATYKWFDSGKNEIGGQNSNIYREKFTSAGQYTRYVRVTYPDASFKETSCAARVDTCNKPNNTSCVAGTRQEYSCNQDGTYTTTTINCNDTNVDQARATFSFRPNIVRQTAQCGLYLEAQNVQSCTLTGKSDPLLSISSDLLNKSISESGTRTLGVGTYTLSCVDLVGVSRPFDNPKACISNPEIKEN